ncbi:hypothetical protein Plec18167_001607 [Paecilomyces lecythidis]|uniref:Pal1 cell morphology protein n=1 Tax=Paecilomyces lecythidis TaxID=3004212 RepID=A0ABR3Y9G1_9EURO
MSLAPLSAPERQPSPQLNINLSSNNPFRNRAVSPSAASPVSVNSAGRPVSTNPFLDEADLTSPQSAPGVSMASASKPSAMSNAAELFENLSLEPAESTSSRRPAPSRPSNKPPSRPRKERSQTRTKDSDPFDIFADPPSSSSKPPHRSKSHDVRRPRRNSESSIMERPQKPLDPEDEKRRRERRHRERDARHRDGKSRSSKKPSHRLDIIDKLDVTSIYGTGLFHHDGPFDACNPHRNRKGLKTAPMQAFPKDSRNMALGGAGPNNNNIDLELFHGVQTEGYNDFATSGKADQPEAFSATTRVEPIHGDLSMGLGTSTFLEGAPASRSAIQRRQSENETSGAPNGGGLQRKKSLAQRIRGGINPRTGGGRVVSPDAVYSTPSSTGSKTNERNPFFQDDYDDAWDKKGAKIQMAEDSRPSSESGGRARAASSPRRPQGLERKNTDERANGGGDGMKAGGGFVSRMKSLRKPRPERRPTADS